MERKCCQCEQEFLPWEAPQGTLIFTTCQKCYHENKEHAIKLESEPISSRRQRMLDTGNQ